MKKFLAQFVVLMSFSIAVICSCEQKSAPSKIEMTETYSLSQENSTIQEDLSRIDE
ncbi:MAG: hypothetical protein LW688_11140 [Cryomorphaceae bacterium]|nr:hypothetical protein [Cryomorphaceae bacterium]